MFETLTFSTEEKLMYRFQHFKFLLSDHVCFRVFFSTHQGWPWRGTWPYRSRNGRSVNDTANCWPRKVLPKLCAAGVEVKSQKSSAWQFCENVTKIWDGDGYPWPFRNGELWPTQRLGMKFGHGWVMTWSVFDRFLWTKVGGSSKLISS